MACWWTRACAKSCAYANVKLGVLDAVQRGAAKVVHRFKLGDVDGGYLQCKAAMSVAMGSVNVIQTWA